MTQGCIEMAENGRRQVLHGLQEDLNVTVQEPFRPEFSGPPDVFRLAADQVEMVLVAGNAGVMKRQPDPAPLPSGKPLPQFVAVFRIVTDLHPETDGDLFPVGLLQSTAFGEIGIEIGLGQPCPFRVADPALHVLEKTDFPQALADGGADVVLHLADGVTTEPGVDVAVDEDVDSGGVVIHFSSSTGGGSVRRDWNSNGK